MSIQVCWVAEMPICLSAHRVGEPEGPTDHAGDRATESQICVDETRHGAQNKAATAEGEGSAVEK